jgi:hypothetical protein
MRAHFGLPSITGMYIFIYILLDTYINKYTYSWCMNLYHMHIDTYIYTYTYLYHAYTGEDAEHWRAPIEVKFEIPYFTVSGLQVRYLKIIEKSGIHI